MRKNRSFNLLVAFALLALFAGSAAFAQEQVGSIEGSVADKDGAALPGVTVEAAGTAGALAATTDANGLYRFPRLASGVYKLSAKLQGFVTAESSVDVTLGRVLRANFTLQAGTFAEEITVASGGVAIDVSQSATTKSISREQLDLLPRGRDFTAVVTQAAGVANESFAGGISMDGASGSENRFIIDGVDTTDPQTGVSAQNMVADLIEEVQVKTAGYAAEFGGSTGGVVSAITKTGGNDWHGTIGMYFRNGNFLGADRGVARRSEKTNDYEHRTYLKDNDTRWEPSLLLSGPVLRDKLWFFLAYQPGLRTIDRKTTMAGGVGSNNYTQYINEQYLVANLKGNVGSKFLYKLAWNYSPQSNQNGLPARDGSTPLGSKLDAKSYFPTSSYSAYADMILTDKFLISAKIGYFNTNQNDSGFPGNPDIAFAGSHSSIKSQLPPNLQQATNTWRTNAFLSKTSADRYQRKGAALDASWFVEALGSHSFKFGAQYEKMQNTVNSGAVANQLIYRWDRTSRWFGKRGKWGAVEVRRITVEGDVAQINTGFFVQDSWSINRNFTVNLGVRTEKESVPNYKPEYGKYAIQFKYGDKLAPRLGFAWDLGGTQQWKVYGSFGTYYDITKMEMPRGSFGGDHWISYDYAMDNPDYFTAALQCEKVNNTPTQNPCPGNLIGPFLGAINLREPSTGANGGVDQKMKPMEQRELQLGVDHQLSSDIMVGARFVNKHLVRTIEDVGHRVVLANGSETEIFTICNPGEGDCKVIFPNNPEVPNSPKAKRDYNAMELTFNRRFVKNWMVNAVYTYSRLYGNYSGLASSDEYGRTSPNVNRFFDSLSSNFDEKGRTTEGLLNTDRTHQLKVQAIYQFPFKLSVGLNQYIASGTINSTRYSYEGVWYYAKGREDMGRTPTYSQTDLMLTKDFKVANFNLQASLNIVNLFDQKTVTQVGVDKWDADITLNCNPDEDGQVCFFRNAKQTGGFDSEAIALQQEAQDPKENSRNIYYNKAIGWQGARQIRLGIKLTF